MDLDSIKLDKYHGKKHWHRGSFYSRKKAALTVGMPRLFWTASLF